MQAETTVEPGNRQHDDIQREVPRAPDRVQIGVRIIESESRGREARGGDMAQQNERDQKPEHDLRDFARWHF